MEGPYGWSSKELHEGDRRAKVGKRVLRWNVRPEKRLPPNGLDVEKPHRKLMVQNARCIPEPIGLHKIMFDRFEQYSTDPRGEGVYPSLVLLENARHFSTPALRRRCGDPGHLEGMIDVARHDGLANKEGQQPTGCEVAARFMPSSRSQMVSRDGRDCPALRLSCVILDSCTT